MAGRGPAPKDQAKRARRNKQPDLRVILTEPVDQPELPKVFVATDDGEVEFVWPERTQEWWRKWREEWPPSDEFTAMDWEYLLDTAMLHARMWQGDHKLAAEIRLRVASFGVSPADRARLRITFAQADAADGGAPELQSASGSSRERYGALRVAE